MLRGEWAYALGWAAPGRRASALGFVVPLMFLLGSLFALLWGTAYFLGRNESSRERARGRGCRRWVVLPTRSVPDG